jgi:anaerobic ribonucleoside-triphosphate reductase activating protein
MKFHGLIKSTLVDYPEKLACTLFTGGCNLRCPFCQNSDLVLNPESQPYLDEEEINKFLEKRKRYMDGVCITGGEPLIQEGVVEFCRYLKSLGYLVKLDTNGTLPDKLQNLLDLNLLDYVAMDVKSDRAGYAESVGYSNINIEPFEKSIEILKHSKIDHEFRTTVVKEFHGIEELINIAKWIGKDQKYYLQTFSDRGSNIQQGLHGYSADEEKAMVKVLKSYIDSVQIRGI